MKMPVQPIGSKYAAAKKKYADQRSKGATVQEKRRSS
jgi:hypothetical protein